MDVFRSPGGRHYIFDIGGQQYVEIEYDEVAGEILSQDPSHYQEQDTQISPVQASYDCEPSIQSQLTSNTDSTQTRKKRKPNEKDRLCHLIPEDLLLQVEEHLLRLVFCNPPIWDHTIDIKERHAENKMKKWTNIHSDMIKFVRQLDVNIELSAMKLVMLKNTWEKIRENYVRYKNECEGKSGSATKEVDPPEHVDIMRNYDGMLVRRKPVSSLQFENCSDKECYTPKSKRKSKDDTEGLAPFLKCATTYFEKMAENEVASNERNSARECNVSEQQLLATDEARDKAVLYANSLVPDLRQFDDQHFAMVKMVISRGIYDCYVKQMEAQSKK